MTRSREATKVAVRGNAVVTIMKFSAFLATGSGSMLSEAIHSLADTGNQYLLKVGVKRSERPPTGSHPYGYANERYVFGLMSGVGIFFLG